MLKLFMPLLCPVDKLKDNNEIVLCDSELSKQAHIELFHYKETVYITSGYGEDYFRTMVETINECNSDRIKNISKIHITSNWLNLLKVALWKAERPTINNVIALLKSIGIGDNELLPFRQSEIDDIFPWLYYGKRFDMLRKICHSAKRQMEGHLDNRFIRVDCHLISEDSKRIVASSL